MAKRKQLRHRNVQYSNMNTRRVVRQGTDLMMGAGALIIGAGTLGLVKNAIK